MDRFRLLAALLAIVLLAVLAIPVGVAAAQILRPAGPAAAASPAELEEEAENEAEEAEGSEDEPDECEFEDEALEEACEKEAEGREAEVAEEAEAEECRLESAEATVAVLPGRNQVRLTVRYRTFEPSAVAIDLALRGAKGALDLGTQTAHFGRSGTLHAPQTLTAPQMARAMAAKEFTVGIHALNTPGFCNEAFAQHLTSREGNGAGLQWSAPSAGRRAKPAPARRA